MQAAAIRNKIGKVGVDEGALAEALVEVRRGLLDCWIGRHGASRSGLDKLAAARGKPAASLCNDKHFLPQRHLQTMDAAHAAATLAQQHSQLADGRGHAGLGPWRG